MAMKIILTIKQKRYQIKLNGIGVKRLNSVGNVSWESIQNSSDRAKHLEKVFLTWSHCLQNTTQWKAPPPPPRTDHFFSEALYQAVLGWARTFIQRYFSEGGGFFREACLGGSVGFWDWVFVLEPRTKGYCLRPLACSTLDFNLILISGPFVGKLNNMILTNLQYMLVKYAKSFMIGHFFHHFNIYTADRLFLDGR